MIRYVVSNVIKAPLDSLLRTRIHDKLAIYCVPYVRTFIYGEVEITKTNLALLGSGLREEEVKT